MLKIAQNCYSEISTDMSIGQILGYAEEVQEIPMESMGIYAVPGQFCNYNGLSMWSPHKDEYVQMFNTYFNPHGAPITTSDIQMIELHKKLGQSTRPSEVEQGGALSNVKK